MAVIVYLSTVKEDGTRVASYAEEPRTTDVMADQHDFLDPDGDFYGRPAQEWPAGRYRVENGQLLWDDVEPPVLEEAP